MIFWRSMRPPLLAIIVMAGLTAYPLFAEYRASLTQLSFNIFSQQEDNTNDPMTDPAEITSDATSPTPPFPAVILPSQPSDPFTSPTT